MTLLPQTVERVEELQAAGLGQREATRQLQAEGHRISRTSVRAIFQGRRPRQSQGEEPSEDGPREVPAYVCGGCGMRVRLWPCQVCRARAYRDAK